MTTLFELTYAKYSNANANFSIGKKRNFHFYTGKLTQSPSEQVN